MSMAKILLVEDDENMATAIDDAVTFEKHVLDVAHDGQEGLDILAVSQYDLIILDWELPHVTGIEILQRLRSKGMSTPILMLTGKGMLEDKESGLNAGADDYLTKPFHMRELCARIRALLRRQSQTVGSEFKAGGITLDAAKFKVYRDGQEIQLARLEFAVLEFLMRNRGQVFSNEALLERVWPVDSERTPQSVRTLIQKLRQKIDGDGPSIIKNVHGVGYKLEGP